MEGIVSIPGSTTFKRTFRYGRHHIEETREVALRDGKVTIRHIIDGWERIDGGHLPHIFKYLDKVDSRNEELFPR